MNVRLIKMVMIRVYEKLPEVRALKAREFQEYLHQLN
jgi:hypothetical protein